MDFIVITTIQAPTSCVCELIVRGKQQRFSIFIVGDRKTPSVVWPNGADFLGLSDQLRLDYQLIAKLPENHYARKNIGYLEAIAKGARMIFDTDDDNTPLPEWRVRDILVPARGCAANRWVNVYQWFTDEMIWPRGLPLDCIREVSVNAELGPLSEHDAPIQQGLANGSPDVDAVWRLIHDREIHFYHSDSICLLPGTWSPFNSQCTWWFPQAFPLLYLPSFVSFRMTDIWRSFIAQRCLWEMGLGVVFHGPEMVQDRNPHNLLRDFEQEIPGYLGNARLCDTLEKVQLSSRSDAIASNLHRCYEALIRAGFMLSKEIKLVESWLIDLEACR